MFITKEEIIGIVKNVKHPEIANTFDELSMLRDIDFDERTPKDIVNIGFAHDGNSLIR